MKLMVGVIAMASSLSAMATSLPNYPASVVRGAVLSSLTERADFEFDPGTVGNCTRSDATGITSFTCDVSGVTAFVRSASGTSLRVNFTSLVAQYVTPPLSDEYYRFIFSGNYAEPYGPTRIHSAVRMELWAYTATPSDIRGTLTLSYYSLSGAIQATPVGGR